MSEVLSAFKEIKSMTELESSEKIVLIRADNGKSEFGTSFQSYCKEVGIQFEPSPPYKHSMNGVVERWIGSTETIARSMLYEAGLPHQLWDYAIEHSVWIKNRVPTAALPFDKILEKTPFEAYYSKLASLKNLKVFGCKSNILYPPELNPQTWVPRTREGKFIMVGMQSSKIWKLLDVLTLKEAISADVKFDEYSFRKIDISRFAQSTNEVKLTSRTQGVSVPIYGKPKGVKQKVKTYTLISPSESNRTFIQNNKDRSSHLRDETRIENAGDKSIHLRDEARIENAGDKSIHLRDEARIENAGDKSIHLRDETRIENAGDKSIHLRDEARIENAKNKIDHLGDESCINSLNNNANANANANANPKTERRSRYGRLIKDKTFSVFSRDIAVAATAQQIVHINSNESSSIQVPTPPFESITVEKAMEEDKERWTEAIRSELRSLEKTGTFTILKGQPPKGRKVIS
ncbi:hypothetical protein K3495_g15500, partial [Podosphaera aphanis]